MNAGSVAARQLSATETKPNPRCSIAHELLLIGDAFMDFDPIDSDARDIDAMDSADVKTDIQQLIASLNVNVLHTALAGSLRYGLNHADSDVDVRGIYASPAENCFQLKFQSRPIERMVDAKSNSTDSEKQTQIDLVLFEITQFCQLLAKKNGKSLELLFSEPFTQHSAPALSGLRVIVNEQKVKHFGHHFRGFAKGERAEFLRGHPDAPNWKHLAQALRSLLTGIHFLRTGEVLCQIDDLIAANAIFNSAEQQTLTSIIALKRKSIHNSELTSGAVKALRQDSLSLIDATFAKFELAFDETPLATDSHLSDELDRWLVNFRKSQLSAMP